ncbi:metalloregulator ArsR/SmtB family transcription factor [Erythrobacter insulae]|uniref:Metalloregulator ArsR/SmtB family transcription factor n=1 Tax=Erythrobacter insulae TaxID=2584124 RepID=A0A547PCE5_9SPHN|nr:metalloregulator ArsR/SmtB family transcription factor [Erythrobacter insulae]TRD11816.1 metalloregulator ArsR/SmtB family transcription factor [Erythrobacter insulae]
MPVDTLFKALADPTRLRIARLLGTMELAVGELAQALGQSQPRVSRHVGILCDAGLAERRREGSWVFLRSTGGSDNANPVMEALDQLLAIAERENAEFAQICDSDRRKLAAIREAREDTAESYFARHASDWDDLRALHSSDAQVEGRLAKALSDAPLGAVLDIGTGTGRMAEFFAKDADHIVAVDKNLEMLRVARAKLQHLPAAQIELVQGDFSDLPFGDAGFDTVLFHQVLHFAQDPALPLSEAARVTRMGGRIAIVDFASHDREELRSRHQHARLGFTDEQMRDLLNSAGFAAQDPIALDGGELIVKIWLGQRCETLPERNPNTPDPNTST